VRKWYLAPAIKDANTWPFDTEQYLLFNVAILPNIESSFTESTLEVDYVRIYQESTLSSNEIEEKSVVSLYPNPVNDVLQIDTKNGEINIDTVQILDVNGRIISSTNESENNQDITLDTSRLKQGIYFVKVQLKNGSTSIDKVIKR